ncbi:hypothetical protein [Plantactinospora sp. B5E13]|uniref:hypothetical protein n=1 Tax=Plantactinospora sp. B5E13 TaxID=3153758 RepID=UPI00325E9B29
MLDISWDSLALAALFATFTGFNDAGALVGIGLRIRGFRPITGLVLLAAAVGADPVVLGTAVAATLGQRRVAPSTVPTPGPPSPREWVARSW